MAYKKVRGLITKNDKFFVMVSQKKYDIISVTKTWLNPTVNSLELFIEQVKGGGLPLAVRSNVLDEQFPIIDTVMCKCFLTLKSI